MSSRPNADELMGFALEASEHVGALPREERPGHMSAMARVHSSLDNAHAALVELSKGDSKAARPWLLRALYLIGGALAADKASAPEEPRDERRYTRAEVDELLGRTKTKLALQPTEIIRSQPSNLISSLGRTKTNLETLGAIYHATMDESDANLRRAIAAEMEVQGLRGQMERLAKKGGA